MKIDYSSGILLKWVGLSKLESSASMSERGVSIKHKRLKVSGKVFSFAKYLLSMIDRVSLTYFGRVRKLL